MQIKNVQIGGMEFIDIQKDVVPIQLRTVLGSCVSIVLADSVRGLVGMSHILLPSSKQSIPDDPLKYGKNAFPMLLIGMLSRGGHREDLSAWIAGGANMLTQKDLQEKYHHIGTSNIACAKDFVSSRGINLIASEVGGNKARTLTFSLPDYKFNIQQLV